MARLPLSGAIEAPSSLADLSGGEGMLGTSGSASIRIAPCSSFASGASLGPGSSLAPAASLASGASTASGTPLASGAGVSTKGNLEGSDRSKSYNGSYSGDRGPGAISSIVRGKIIDSPSPLSKQSTHSGTKGRQTVYPWNQGAEWQQFRGAFLAWRTAQPPPLHNSNSARQIADKVVAFAL